MKITDREVYDWLIISTRYAKTRNNHLEPAYTYEQAIDVLNRWENEEYKIQTAKQILSELAFDAYFINDEIENSPQAKGIAALLRKEYITFATKLADIADPKATDEEIRKQVEKIMIQIGLVPRSR